MFKVAVNSWDVWHTLLYQRSPYPLFVRIAPRAHIPGEFSFWYILTGYTFVGMLTVLFTSSFALQDELSAVIFVVFMYPSMLVGLFAMVFSPFVLVGGIMFGLRFANNICTELQTLDRIHMSDLIATSPPGQLGIYRAICAATLRQKNLFMGLGIYDGSAAHLTLGTGLVVPVIFLALSPTPYRTTVDSMSIAISGLITALMVVVLSAVAIILLHLDFRQYLVLGVMAGICGATVLRDRLDVQTGTLAIFGGVSMAGVVVIVMVAGSAGLVLSSGMLPENTIMVGAIGATLAGYGLGIAAKETIMQQLWLILSDREGIKIA